MNNKSYRSNSENGYALFVAMMLIVIMGATLAIYHSLTSIELATVGASVSQEKSFYAAEGALNARAEEFRQVFNDFGSPAGASPSETNPCTGSNNGSGDFICKEYTFGNNVVKTYVIPGATNPSTVTIPSGEDYAGLYAIQNSYAIHALATRADGSTGVSLGLNIKSRSVPIYQFAIFSNVDTSLHPNQMDITGPVHVNGDFFVNTTAELNIYGLVSVTGQIVHGVNDNSCSAGTVRMPHLTPTMPYNTGMLTELTGPYGCSGINARDLGGNNFSAWNGMVRQAVDEIVVPELSELDPVAGANFWDAADLRLVLKVNASEQMASAYSTTGIEVRNQNNGANVGLTNLLDSCTNPSGIARFGGKPVNITSSQYGDNSLRMYSPIDNDIITMLEVDMRSLLSCLHSTGIVALDDTTDGGLVIYLTVEGPNSSTLNTYGVRITNASELSATVGGAPTIQGLTLVTNQALYINGDYNITNKKPAALISDSINVLSQNWSDLESHNHNPTIEASGYAARVASNTTINSAIISGSVIETGIHNITRLHEDWYSAPRKSLTLLGSIISLSPPTKTNNLMINHGIGVIGATYSPPDRFFNFDPSFNNPDTLPPASSKFTYLKQTLFSRSFDS